MTATGAAERASGARNVVTFAVLAVAIASFTLLQSLIVPVLSVIEREFDTDQSTVTWVLTAYLLSASIATPLLGRIGDAVGKTKMFALTLAMLSLGSLLATLAPSVGWLIAARVIQGAGGGVLPLAFGIARDEFEGRVEAALSVLASLAAVGFGFGIVLAGPLVDLLGFSALFWLPMIVTAVAAAATVVFIPESPVRTSGRLPVWPAVLLAVWLTALLLALSKGNDWGWVSPRVLGLFVVAALGLAGWVLIEQRVPVPMIDMEMMRLRGVWSANAVTVFVGVGIFAAFGFLPQFIQTPSEAGYGFDATITESGRLLLPSAVMSFAMGFCNAPLLRRYGARTMVLVGTMVTAAAYLLIALFHAEQWQVLCGALLQGVGTGLIIATLANVVISAVPAHQTGVASGMNANIRTIGGSLGTAAMSGIVTARIGVEGFPVETGYTIGFVVLTGAMVCSAVAALFIPDLREQQTRSRLADADNAELGFLPAAAATGERSERAS